MVLTERATVLADPLRAALASVRDALRSGATFDPATAERRFVIASSDYAQFAAMPHVMHEIRAQAPGVSIAMVSPGPDLARLLESGDVDLAILPETVTNGCARPS